MAVAVPTGVGDKTVIPAPVTVVDAAALPVDDVLARLGAAAQGLSAGEAAKRLQLTGPNAVRSYRARAPAHSGTACGRRAPSSWQSTPPAPPAAGMPA